MNKALLAIGMLLLTLGCFGRMKYTAPQALQAYADSVVVDLPRDQAMELFVPALSKWHYSVLDVDKVTGVVGLGYVGNPEPYVDCGKIYSKVANMRGGREYDFPASRTRVIYETIYEGIYQRVDRKLLLDAKVNVVFEPLSTSQTKVSVKANYVLNRTLIQYKVNEQSETFTDSISFSSNQAGRFPRNSDQCQPTGQMEAEILTLVAGKK